MSATNLAAKEASPCTCSCSPGRETAIQCERYLKPTLHRDNADKISPFSETIEIYVGPSMQVFHIHKELLSLHSVLFKNTLAEQNRTGDKRHIEIPDADASEFAEFVCWLFNYDFIPVEDVVLHKDAILLYERLWQLGSDLQAPGYQNFLMDGILAYCRDEANPWPVPGLVASIYQFTSAGSKLRTFCAHSIIRRSSMERQLGGDQDLNLDAWDAVLEENPDLCRDIYADSMTQKKWKGLYPWDDKHRHMYMEDEIPLDQRWEEHILARRSEDEIKAGAKDGCPRSLIELDHFQRKEGRGAEKNM